MPTSLTNTARIDQYLHKKMSTGDALVFEARLLLQPDLADDIHWQQKTYSLVQNYGRVQLKQEIEIVHQQLFTDSKYHLFRQKIKALFKKQ